MGKLKKNQPGYTQGRDKNGRTIWVPDGSAQSTHSASGGAQSAVGDFADNTDDKKTDVDFSASELAHIAQEMMDIGVMGKYDEMRRHLDNDMTHTEGEEYREELVRDDGYDDELEEINSAEERELMEYEEFLDPEKINHYVQQHYDSLVDDQGNIHKGKTLLSYIYNSPSDDDYLGRDLSLETVDRLKNTP